MGTNQTKLLWPVLGLWLGLAFSPFASAVTLSIQPTPKAVSVDEIFSIDIAVSGVSDLNSFQFDLAFLPSLLEATGVSEGPFLPSSGYTSFFTRSIDNGSGTISTADVLVGYPVSVSGNGVLATVTFKALGAGTSFLDLSNVLLQNFQGSEITAEWTNGVADIQEGNNAIPSPATPLLLLSGWLGFCLRRRLDKCQ